MTVERPGVDWKKLRATGTIAVVMPRLGLLVLAGSIALFFGFIPLASAEVSYTAEDLATVRVLAVSGVTEGSVSPTTGPRQGKNLKFARISAGHGSGVLISSDGLILTAQHVIKDAEYIAVRIPERKGALMAEVVYENENHDVAFLKVSGEFTNIVPIPDEQPTLTARQSVFALGYPLDGTRDFPQSTAGVVSGTMKSGELQLGISVNPGNSGGPLITQDGKLVGVVVRSSDSSKGIQGIGVAVPYDIIKRYYDARVLPSTRLTYLKTQNATRSGWSGAAEVVAQLASRHTDAIFDYIESTDKTFKVGLTAALRTHKEAPDFLALAAAHYWNTSVVLLALGGDTEEASKAAHRAKILADYAAKTDPTVMNRSPFLFAARGMEPPENSSASFSIPRKLGGFALGWTLDLAKDACTIEELEFSKNGATSTCSEVPNAKSLTGPVELEECGGSICKIDVIHRPSKALSTVWTSEMKRLLQSLEGRYGKHTSKKVNIPPACNNQMLKCLKEGKILIRYSWEQPESRMALTMGSLRGEPTIRVRLEKK